MYHKILVPLDGSKLAEIALTSVFYQAKDSDAEVVLLSVITEHTSSTDLMESDEDVKAEGRAAYLRNYLEQHAEKLRAGDLKVSCVTLTGPAAETIVDYAKNNNVDCIIMAAQGQSGSLRWPLGSIADKILHWATIPVLLVRVKA